jgi:hypothetical protein
VPAERAQRVLVVAASAERAEILRAALLEPGRDVVVVERPRLGTALVDAAGQGRAFVALVIDVAVSDPPARAPLPVVVGDPERPDELARALLHRLALPPEPPLPTLPAIDLSRPFRDLKKDAVASFERSYLEALVAAHGGNLARAARTAGLDRKALWRLLGKHGLARPKRLRKTRPAS